MFRSTTAGEHRRQARRGLSLAAAFATALVAAGLGCGGDAPAPEGDSGSARRASADNEAPRIDGLTLQPEFPNAGDSITIVVRANDPDRDSLDTWVDWYRNGNLYEEDGEFALEPFSFERGDRIWAEVTVSDGVVDVVETSDSVLLENAPPRIRAIRITPDDGATTDLLSAEVEGVDDDGDPVSFEYRWSINGQAVTGAGSARLEPRTAKRKDRVVAEARASDGESFGKWFASPEHVMRNAPPEITTMPNYALSGTGVYRYDVRGEDPDGDRPLKYELVQGPPGMSVDITSGVVSWTVPASANGVYPVELSVSDPWGARTLQRYSLEVAWDEQPASPAPDAPRASDSESDPDYDDF